jgi:hypothetical protein
MLDTFIIPRLVNQTLMTLGMDSIEQCLDPEHWKKYPYTVEYVFNDRGYRDQNWPSDLSNAIWCFGDSFTQGLGSPRAHTWCAVLSQKLNYPVITVSMNGGSNAWIARKIQELLAEIRPRAVIAQWSYTHRRELPMDNKDSMSGLNNKLWQEFYSVIQDPSWPSCDTLAEFSNLPRIIQKEIQEQHYSPWSSIWFDHSGEPKLCNYLDEERMQHFLDNCSPEDDAADTVNHVNSVHDVCAQQSVPLVYGFIPDFAALPEAQQILRQTPGLCWGETPQLDFARDSHHYDQITAEYVVEQILQRLGDAIV